MDKISPIINAKDFLQLFDDTALVIIDARSGPAGRAAYEQGHVKGALHVDLNHDLSDIKKDLADGGRHPLASLEQFSSLLGHFGISPSSKIVVYDDKGGANAASRFWWMMRAIGHESIQVLDGGIQAAAAIGLRMSADQETPRSSEQYPVSGWQLPLSTMDEVETVVHKKGYLVIDVRAPFRYNGESEPIDLIAGHIPGAQNVPFATNLTEEGLFKSQEELRGIYQDLMAHRPIENVIVHCGSGVTACHTLLAMSYAGLEIPKLYPGSWSEWSRNDKPVGKRV